MKVFILVLCLVCLISFKSYAITEDFVKIKEISDGVVVGLSTDSEKVLALSHFVHEKLTPDASKGISPSAIMSTIDRLESGVGWCNHQVAVFMRLAEAQKIKTRMLYLLNKEGTDSPHTIGEAFVSGKWVIVDPLFDLKGLYSRYDVSKNPELLKNEALLQERKIVVYKGNEAKFDEWIEFYTNPALFVYGLE